MAGRRLEQFFSCLVVRASVLKNHLATAGKMKAKYARSDRGSELREILQNGNRIILYFRMTPLDTASVLHYPYSVYKKTGTSSVSTNIVFFDSPILGKHS